MRNLSLDKGRDATLRILCLGAHSDDIEIGCGGSILKLVSQYDDVDVHWVVLGSSGQRDGEAEASAGKFLKKVKRKNIIIENFKDGFFPYSGDKVKTFFEGLKGRVSPDIIFTHYRNDFHQDHRLISELTWNTFRDHIILEYEVIKYDGDLGAPNFFIHLTKKFAEDKVDYLMKHFKTQADKDWFTPDAFLSIMRIRGIESKAPEKYAEGFYVRKAVLSL